MKSESSTEKCLKWVFHLECCPDIKSKNRDKNTKKIKLLKKNQLKSRQRIHSSQWDKLHAPRNSVTTKLNRNLLTKLLDNRKNRVIIFWSGQMNKKFRKTTGTMLLLLILIWCKWSIWLKRKYRFQWFQFRLCFVT